MLAYWLAEPDRGQDGQEQPLPRAPVPPPAELVDDTAKVLQAIRDALHRGAPPAKGEAP